MGEEAREGNEVGELGGLASVGLEARMCRLEGQLELPGDRLEVGLVRGQGRAAPGFSATSFGL